MRLRTRLTALVAATGLTAGLAIAGSPAAGAQETGSTPLASVLLADGDDFDNNPYDFDIVTQAVLAVFDEKPGSPVSALTDGDVALTAFIPNDRAFQVLVGDLTGEWYGFFNFDEAAVFDAVASLGIDTVETVLLYHVVVGDPISSDVAANVPRFTPLTTAQGGEIRVFPIIPFFKWVVLIDNDPDDFDPFLVPSKLDINAGNNQVAHGIGFVLRPLDVESLL